MYFKKIKDLRIDHDLYQKQIANLFKITRQQYGLYESGKRDIPVDLLIKLADFYNVSIDYMLGRTKNKEVNKNWGITNPQFSFFQYLLSINQLF